MSAAWVASLIDSGLLTAELSNMTTSEFDSVVANMSLAEMNELTHALTAKELNMIVDTLNTTHARTLLGSLNTVELLELIAALPGQVKDFLGDIGILPYTDRNCGAVMMRTVWVLLALSTVVLACRIGVKARTTRRLFYDDSAMLCALIFGYIHAALVTLAYKNGFGRHLIYLTKKQYSESIRYGYYTLAWGILSPMAGRIGFCIFLMYVSGSDSRVKKWWIFLIIALQLVFNLLSVLLLYIQCGSHLDVIWTATFPQYRQYCWDASIQVDYGYWAGAFNTLTDIFLTLLPAYLVNTTSLPRMQKLGVAFTLCLSVLAMVASIVKTYESRALGEVLDYTYDLVVYVIWISIELNVVIICSSIPYLRPLFRGTITSLRRNITHHRQTHQRDRDRKHTSRSQTEFSEDLADADADTVSQLEPPGSINLPSLLDKARTRIKVSAVSVALNNRSTNSNNNNNSSGGSGSRLSRTESEERIRGDAAGADMYGITRTVETSVSYSQEQVTFVHAAIVGLVQGERAVLGRGRGRGR